MEKYKAIPDGYMTVGEVAKKMGVTVRTLQYYDKEGLLSPSSESEGGRRLYTDRDLVLLHQILSLKHLGFSLDEIRRNLTSLETPTDVANALTKQADEVKVRISALSETLNELNLLKAEVLQMQTVNFKKYADIIVNLQMKNEFYWLIKHFDDKTLDHVRKRFNRDNGIAFMDAFNRLQDEIVELNNSGVLPDSEMAQDAAKRFWQMVMDFTNGDMSILPGIINIGNANYGDNDWGQKQTIVNDYIEKSLDIYFTKLGINPFENAEGTK